MAGAAAFYLTAVVDSGPHEPAPRAARLRLLQALLTAGACPRCALRFLHVRTPAAYEAPAPAPAALAAAAAAATTAEASSPLLSDAGRFIACCACLGVLSAEDGAASAAAADAGHSRTSGAGPGPASFAALSAAVRAAGHVRPVGMYLQVMLPGSLAVRQARLWQHLAPHRRDGGTPDATGAPPSRPICLRDQAVPLREAVSWTYGSRLAAEVGAVYRGLHPVGGVGPGNVADVHCQLSYEHSTAAAETEWLLPPAAGGRDGGARFGEGGGGRKRKGPRLTEASQVCYAFQAGRCKRGDACKFSHGRPSQAAAEGDVGGGPDAEAAPAAPPVVPGLSFEAAVRALDLLRDAETALAHAVGPGPPIAAPPVRATVVVGRCAPAYVAGYYTKLARGLSQSPWTIDDERHGDGSVQELIETALCPLLGSMPPAKLMGAGREDMDVRMLGQGRPFVMELADPRQPTPTAEALAAAAAALASRDVGVELSGLRLANRSVCDLLREGEGEKEKAYGALVWLSRRVTAADVARLAAVRDLVVQQATPVRVLHRRAPLTRPRTIYALEAEAVAGAPHYMLLRLRTQAGTYVKEFVHGDLGRTVPSVGSLLGCRADILQLDVLGVAMDFV